MISETRRRWRSIAAVQEHAIGPFRSNLSRVASLRRARTTRALDLKPSDAGYLADVERTLKPSSKSSFDRVTVERTIARCAEWDDSSVAAYNNAKTLYLSVRRRISAATSSSLLNTRPGSPYYSVTSGNSARFNSGGGRKVAKSPKRCPDGCPPIIRPGCFRSSCPGNSTSLCRSWRGNVLVGERTGPGSARSLDSRTRPGFATYSGPFRGSPNVSLLGPGNQNSRFRLS